MTFAPARRGRTIRFGIRLHFIVRETEGAAWDAANDLIRHVSDADIAAFQHAISTTESVGQQRMIRPGCRRWFSGQPPVA